MESLHLGRAIADEFVSSFLDLPCTCSKKQTLSITLAGSDSSLLHGYTPGPAAWELLACRRSEPPVLRSLLHLCRLSASTSASATCLLSPQRARLQGPASSGLPGASACLWQRLHASFLPLRLNIPKVRGKIANLGLVCRIPKLEAQQRNKLLDAPKAGSPISQRLSCRAGVRKVRPKPSGPGFVSSFGVFGLFANHLLSRILRRNFGLVFN